jgi:hypothetical protein
MKYILVVALLSGGTERFAEVYDRDVCERLAAIVVQDIYEVKSTKCEVAGEEV